MKLSLPPKLNLTLCMTKIRVLVLGFHYFTDKDYFELHECIFDEVQDLDANLDQYIL
jgi:hypothetical protein